MNKLPLLNKIIYLFYAINAIALLVFKSTYQFLLLVVIAILFYFYSGLLINSNPLKIKQRNYSRFLPIIGPVLFSVSLFFLHPTYGNNQIISYILMTIATVSFLYDLIYEKIYKKN